MLFDLSSHASILVVLVEQMEGDMVACVFDGEYLIG
jgi:hypothetical protein